MAAQSAFEKYGQKSRRELFLDEREQVVPWPALEALVQPHYPKAGNGRQPVGLRIMLRMYFVQQWFNVSDPGVEEALDESPALRRFVGVDLGVAPAPDETTVCRFRHLLEKHDLGGLMLEAVNVHLEAKGQADYIMVDEAQDLNPVLLDVLNRSACQIVYVGDPYQQIYEWRGAVNAMEQVHTRHRCLLSQSFRFGPEIAAAATIVLRGLGAREPLRGTPTIDSHLGRVRPDAILARTNAGVIGNILRSQVRNVRCAVVGGTKDLERVLTDVQRVKQGQPGQSPELVGFANWKSVMSTSTQPEGESLRPLVNLVQEHGEKRMLRALAGCEANESLAQVVCSTAHRAKGREWNYVHLDPDFEAGFARAERLHSAAAGSAVAAEPRLVYVALTRARLGVHLPRAIARRFGIRSTTGDILGGGAS